MPYGGYGGSVGGSIAQGIQSGFEMGRQIDLDKEAKAQRAVENARREAADARAQRAADLATTHQQLLASQKQRGELASEGARYLQQYGAPEAIPVDVANDYAQRSASAQRSHTAILQKLIGPVQDQKQQAADDASRMQAGQLDPLDPKYPPAQLVHTLTATTRRPLTDFMSQGDQPAPVTQMVNDFRTGMQTGNEGSTLKALNGLFAPELKTGVGQPSPHGGVIVGKQIVKIVPAPPGVAPQQDPNAPPQQDPNAGKVTPVLRVFVREGPDTQAGVGEQSRMASNEQQQYGAPPGATGHYDAPATQNRSTDPNDPIAHISMDDAMNRIGQMETLVAALDHPELRAKVNKGMQDAGTAPNDYLKSFYAVGGTMPTKQQTYENVPIGAHGTLRITKNVQGIETSREMLSPPAGTEKVGPVAQAVKDINAAPGLSDADKAQAVKIKLGLAAKPKAAGTGAGTGAPAGGLKSETVDFYATQSLAGDNSWQVGLARGKVGQQLIAAVKDRIPQMAKELGLSPQDVGTNKAENVALAKTLTDRTKYVTALEQYNNTLLKQGDLVKSLLAKGGATEGGPLFNKPLNAVKGALGDADYNNLRAALVGLAREHQRLLTGPMSNAQLTVSAQHTGDQLASVDLTPSAIVSLIDKVMRQEAQNGLEQGKATLEGVRGQMRGLGRAGSGGGAPAAARPATPAVGTVQGGYRFKGGDPGNQAAWEKVQ